MSRLMFALATAAVSAAGVWWISKKSQNNGQTEWPEARRADMIDPKMIITPPDNTDRGMIRTVPDVDPRFTIQGGRDGQPRRT